jgi:hypothetical protein
MRERNGSKVRKKRRKKMKERKKGWKKGRKTIGNGTVKFVRVHLGKGS